MKINGWELPIIDDNTGCEEEKSVWQITTIRIRRRASAAGGGGGSRRFASLANPRGSTPKLQTNIKDRPP